MHLLWRCTTMAATSFLFSLTLHASVVVGLPAISGNGNCYPFGCGSALSTYQQIYTQTAFPGATNITGVDFFNTQVFNSPNLDTTGTYTLSLSYSSKLVGALDTTNPTNNISSGSQIVFSGPLPALSAGMLDFKGTPFLYNPALGNLLLTVTVSGATNFGFSTPVLFLDQAQTQSATSRAFFFTSGGSAGNDSGGLVTQFDSGTPGTPEPATFSFGILGIGLIVLVGSGKKKIKH